MTPVEIAWVDKYHREIRERVGPLMITERGRKWLEAATSPLQKIDLVCLCYYYHLMIVDGDDDESDDHHKLSIRQSVDQF